MSYPISLILDRILGEELGAYYNRERLKELIKVTVNVNWISAGNLKRNVSCDSFVLFPGKNFVIHFFDMLRISLK